MDALCVIMIEAEGTQAGVPQRVRGERWRAVPTQGHTPPGRSLATAQRVGHSAWIFNGYEELRKHVADLWVLRLDGYHWRREHCEGYTCPPSCVKSAATHDGARVWVYAVNNEDGHVDWFGECEALLDGSAGRQWRECPLPREFGFGHRRSPEIIYALGRLWLFAGHDENDHLYALDHALCYHPDERTWSKVSLGGNVPEPRRQAMCVAARCTRILLIGGYGHSLGPDNGLHVHEINLETLAWTRHDVGKYVITRSYAAVAATDQYLYVVGGHSGLEFLSEMLRIDLDKMDKWERLDHRCSLHKVYAHTLVAVPGRLVLYGGFDGTQFFPKVYELKITDTLLASGYYWSPALHHTFPAELRQRAEAAVAAHAIGSLAFLPRELLWLILELAVC